jgi:Bacterial protein of unknown function (DUF885)
MTSLLKKVPILALMFCTTIWSQNISDTYIMEWKQFYPSKALSDGIHASVFQFENFSEENILKWLDFNEQVLIYLSKENSINPIDGRLLRVQVQSEIDQWKKLSLHTSSLSLYVNSISKALDPVLYADYLIKSEKSNLICQRLAQVAKMSEAAKNNLKTVSEDDLERGINRLTLIVESYKNDLIKSIENDFQITKCANFKNNLATAINSLETLLSFAKNELSTNIKQSETLLGRDEYDRQLKLYTDSELTPEELSKMALEEIETVRSLLGEVSKSYLKLAYSNSPLPETYQQQIDKAFDDMEKDAPLNAEDYLQFWNQLSDAAVKFIEENDIATLPKYQTLRIITAPESAGPAARIGWVASAPPFSPNPVTTLNLPSIPETLPKQEQIDFWASFNRPFNRMIVIHELFPGHYMQLKISRETAHPIRLLFPFGIYTEGWATFTEKVLLDAGWEKENPLTLLAHLRKRLENANRAYTSVQVHCNGWSQDQVLKFSEETSLLAPQFAKSLWGRITNSPMQLTSYFLGGKQFTQLLESEKKRLGKAFDLKFFMDTIMKSGPIPIDEFYTIFANTSPN